MSVEAILVLAVSLWRFDDAIFPGHDCGVGQSKFHKGIIEMLRPGCAVLFAAFVASSPALAARCGGDFNAFMQSMAAEAQAAGVS